MSETLYCRGCRKHKTKDLMTLRPNGHYQCAACAQQARANADPDRVPVRLTTRGERVYLDNVQRARRKNNGVLYEKNNAWWTKL